MNTWRSAVEIEGLLLKGGLEAPESGEQDRFEPRKRMGLTSNREY